ncbi:Exopolyphosphatase [hydrothermal vent metagenome]|uniref:Exopolyphosphatase n=1 Tax=hydrothermal vent metagenome TaxID=652676 RepID=A0A3B0XRQ8_9ZZZZ
MSVCSLLSKNTIAAIDLGSNSFHMVVAEEDQGQLVILDRLREMVRLAEGLDGKGHLDVEVEQRALECLGRLGQRIRTLEAGCVSTVGTNTLRRIKNVDDFIFHAEQALGFPIEIISGIEEARLIYQGVSHTLEQDQQSRLIIDIGGGSTELIIGEGLTPHLMNSLEMGCVMMMKAFFDDGKIKSRRLQAARIFVLQRMKDVHYAYTRTGWEEVIGSSGSIKSIASVIYDMQLAPRDVITRRALAKLVAICSEYKKVKKLDFPGLSERRRAVFLGGLIVLSGVFEALNIETMQVSQGALREGLLYDMVGRRQNDDIRNKSIASLASRFYSDQQHAQRVEKTAFELFQQLKADWFTDVEHATNLLHWACQIHEIGRNISHSSFQKHSAYIIENADLAGFSRQEQRRLATIVRVHRSKLGTDIFKETHKDMHLLISQLSVVLRLSVIFHRSRTDSPLPVIEIRVNQHELFLKLPDRWLNEHPLTINDLQQEAGYLRAIDLKLRTERMV